MGGKFQQELRHLVRGLSSTSFKGCVGLVGVGGFFEALRSLPEGTKGVKGFQRNSPSPRIPSTFSFESPLNPNLYFPDFNLLTLTFKFKFLTQGFGTREPSDRELQA